MKIPIRSLSISDCQLKFASRACALVVICELCVVVRADVLYDTTGMTDEGTYTNVLNCYIGGAAENGGTLRDGQVADDFDLVSTYKITSVTGDFLNSPPAVTPANGILIEFFEDIGGTPSENAYTQVFVTDFVEMSFEDSVFDLAGHRFSIDLSSLDITLSPGTWWLSIVPVDETPSGMRYFQIQTEGFTSGYPTHARDGGVPHGNGYEGVGYGPDWFDLSIAALEGDVAMKIEGALVGGEPCPADLDGDGSVGTSDLLELFAAWGPNPDSPADLNGDGSVGTSDLLVLFANWGLCPK